MFRKALQITKLICQMIVVMLGAFTISLGIHMSVNESLRSPTSQELKDLNNISADLDVKETKAVKKSRNSILQVLSGHEDTSGFTKMSGTYVTRKDRFYVITAAHGVGQRCEYFYVATSSSEIYDCIKYIVVDRQDLLAPAFLATMGT